MVQICTVLTSKEFPWVASLKMPPFAVRRPWDEISAAPQPLGGQRCASSGSTWNGLWSDVYQLEPRIRLKKDLITTDVEKNMKRWLRWLQCSKFRNDRSLRFYSKLLERSASTLAWTWRAAPRLPSYGGLCWVRPDPLVHVTSTCPRVHVSNLLPDFSLDCQTVDPQQKHPDKNPSIIHLAFLCLQEWLYVLNDSVTTPRSWCRTLGKNEHLMPVQQGKWVRKVMRVIHFWVMGRWGCLPILQFARNSDLSLLMPLDRHLQS
jgi:hypothetical protein